MAAPLPHHNSTFAGFDPARGVATAETFLAATPGEVTAAGEWAWEALRSRPNVETASVLEQSAAGLERGGDELIAKAREETGLAESRLRGELARTTFTLRMFASVVRDGSWVEAVIDHGNANRTPLPKLDLRRMLIPVGPVAVFGASNFPLAYGVAGGDTASALAAGCPVIVKGHSAHPGTGALIARHIAEAVRHAGLHRGWFQYLPAGGSRDIELGVELVKHPRVRAVGFTGSVPGGTALVDIANARPEPIPVFAEMGSVNPVFVLAGAMNADGRAIAEKLAQSATNSGGQMCTCPGLIFVVECPATNAFIESLRAAFAAMGPVTMLGPRTAQNYGRRLKEIAGAPGVHVVAGPTPGEGYRAGPVSASATLLEVSFAEFRQAPTLREECFGPETIVVRCANANEFLEAARGMLGSLTGSVFAGDGDEAQCGALLAELADRAGRLIVNGVPTGVEVATAMVHSGPFPACSRPDSTAVGALAIRRWARPVCYQNTPQDLLPEALRDENPRGIGRIVDGVWKGANR